MARLEDGKKVRGLSLLRGLYSYGLTCLTILHLLRVLHVLTFDKFSSGS